MKLGDELKNVISRAASFVARRGEDAVRDARDVDICLLALCTPESLAKTRFPVAYVEFLRTCIEHVDCTVREVKTCDGSDEWTERFTTLLEVLRSGVPPIEFSTASDAALIADRYHALLRPFRFKGWTGDISLHFQLSSSFGRKARILSSTIRYGRSKQLLELGTAYGMSGLFMLEALRANGETGHLITLEGSEPQYSIASEMLKNRYHDTVTCHFGTTEETLPRIAKDVVIDFMFHDAGHSREDYIRDFNAVKNSFAPGALVLIDDIRWEDPLMSQGRALRCYEGWMEICADSKVRRAVEIDNSMGLLLLL